MTKQQKQIFAVGTMDTKGEELRFVADELRAAGVACQTVDVSAGHTNDGDPAADVTRDELMGGSAACSLSDDRGEAVTQMAEHLTHFLLQKLGAGQVAGVIGIGGSGGTALVTQAMRALPIGLPKLLVSTVASGNTAPYIDCSDITMMFSVVDIAGLNSISRRILANAAHAMAGMTQQPDQPTSARPAIGMTMFGVTTPCVDRVRQLLIEQPAETPNNSELTPECFVFHATGTGGRAMEQLVHSGMLQGVIDATTTEVADQVVGGVFPCGAERFERILKSGVPYVLSLGALDMVNFGARDSVPAKFHDRRFHVHNAQVTLMRTSPEENQQIGRWIAGKLNQSTAPVSLLIPELGLSALDIAGGVFHDPAANTALFTSLETHLQQTDARRLTRLPLHINNPEFAEQLVAEYRRLCV